MDESQPLVSIVMATYNYSSVLKYAIQSVLWQTYPNFELWVIGDACTDDSEAVVASFADPRIHWVNLPENSGSQSTPNNAGIARASGKYVAYLGHDDLWHPDHLQLLVDALEGSGADAAHTLLLLNQPTAPRHSLYGLSRSDASHSAIVVMPSSLIHLRTMIEDTGLWRDYRTLRIPPDVDFVNRIHLGGKRFITVSELTVFKFPSGSRKNVYIEKPSHEQSAYVESILHDPEFRYKQLMAVLQEWEMVRGMLEMVFTPPTLEPGALVESWRASRGLVAQEAQAALPLAEDFSTLFQLNLQEDITSNEAREFLLQHQRLPQNDLLLGGGWYGLERDEAGRPFRWLGSEGDVLFTNLEKRCWLLMLDASPGYANSGLPVTLALLDADSKIVDRALVDGKKRLTFAFTPQQRGTVVYKLRVLDSRNQPLPDDPRILNVGVQNLRLERTAAASGLSRLRQLARRLIGR